MLHSNQSLGIPHARSQLIRYAAINSLIQEQQHKKKGQMRGQRGKYLTQSYEDLLKIGANSNRLEKLVRDLTKFDQKYTLFDKNEKQKEDVQNNVARIFQLKSNIENYWRRVFSAAMKVAEHIFNTSDNQYPLQYQNKILNAADDKKSGKDDAYHRQDKKQWVTATDIDYLTLVMIYALLRTAWERNVLILGLVKDIAAADMIKTVLPILQYSGSLTFRRELPRFNSDKMLLQTASIVNA
jgi:hypothetical protein